jgi:hypothetical protein
MQGLLSLMSTIEELLGRKSSGSGLENREYDCRNPLWWPCNALCLQKLALTSPTNGDRLASIVLSQTKVTEFVFFVGCCGNLTIIYNIVFIQSFETWHRYLDTSCTIVI